jgi:hypothetical protein
LSFILKLAFGDELRPNVLTAPAAGVNPRLNPRWPVSSY